MQPGRTQSPCLLGYSWSRQLLRTCFPDPLPGWPPVSVSAPAPWRASLFTVASLQGQGPAPWHCILALEPASGFLFARLLFHEIAGVRWMPSSALIIPRHTVEGRRARCTGWETEVGETNDEVRDPERRLTCLCRHGNHRKTRDENLVTGLTGGPPERWAEGRQPDPSCLVPGFHVEFRPV